MAKKKKAIKKTGKKKTAKKAVAKKSAKKSIKATPAVTAPDSATKKITLTTSTPTPKPIVVSAPEKASAPIKTDNPVRITYPSASQSSAIVSTTFTPATVRKIVPPEMVAMVNNTKRIITSNRHPMRKDEVLKLRDSIPARAFKTTVEFTTAEDGFSITITDLNGEASVRMPEKEGTNYPLSK